MVTVDDLKDLQHLPGEIDQIDAALEELKRQPLLPISPTQRMDYAAAVDDLAGVYTDRRKRCSDQLRRLHAFIDGIPDKITRDIFRLRYERGKCWRNIWAIFLDRGMNYAEDTLRQRHNRYLMEYNKNERNKK